jgi:hypothetical protein
MPAKINWTFTAQVAGGPRVTQAAAVDVEAYDKTEVVIGAGATDVEVEVPSGTTGVLFVLVSSDVYDPAITYTFNAGTTDIPLDGPHLLIGKGAVSLLGATPEKLTISNGMAADATISVLVGRDAIA